MRLVKHFIFLFHVFLHHFLVRAQFITYAYKYYIKSTPKIKIEQSINSRLPSDEMCLCALARISGRTKEEIAKIYISVVYSPKSLPHAHTSQLSPHRFPNQHFVYIHIQTQINLVKE